MSSKLVIRIAAFFVLVHLLGHSIGHLGWDKPEDPKMAEVVAAMKGYSVNFMGATKSMADYYNGYSVVMFGLYGMTILILWIASGLMAGSREIAVKILYPVGITYLFFGVVEYLYFFPFAASMSFLAGVFVLLAITVVKK
jgi:hypothetical protein